MTAGQVDQGLKKEAAFQLDSGEDSSRRKLERARKESLVENTTVLSTNYTFSELTVLVYGFLLPIKQPYN